MNTKNRGKVWIYVFATIWAVITLYPLLFTIISSLKDNTEIFNTMFSFPSEYHFEYYMKALVKGNMARCIMNSFVLAFLSTLLISFISSAAAFVLTRMNIKINGIMLLLFMLGVMIPIHSTLIPLVKMIYSFKGQNNYLIMILLYTAFNLSLSIFIISGYMKSISKEIDEAAIIDGCGQITLFVKIIFPLTKPAISTAAIISFLFIYNELLFAVMFLTDKTKQTISIGLMAFVGQRSTELGPTFASIVLTIVPMVIIYLLFQEKVEKRAYSRCDERIMKKEGERDMNEFQFRQVHLDFHTSEQIKNIGKQFSKEDFQNKLIRGHVNSINIFCKVSPWMGLSSNDSK